MYTIGYLLGQKISGQNFQPDQLANVFGTLPQIIITDNHFSIGLSKGYKDSEALRSQLNSNH